MLVVPRRSLSASLSSKPSEWLQPVIGVCACISVEGGMLDLLSIVLLNYVGTALGLHVGSRCMHRCTL